MEILSPSLSSLSSEDDCCSEKWIQFQVKVVQLMLESELSMEMRKSILSFFEANSSWSSSSSSSSSSYSSPNLFSNDDKGNDDESSKSSTSSSPFEKKDNFENKKDIKVQFRQKPKLTIIKKSSSSSSSSSPTSKSPASSWKKNFSQASETVSSSFSLTASASAKPFHPDESNIVPTSIIPSSTSTRSSVTKRVMVNNIAWIDVEMTGLTSKDAVLEIAIIVTDSSLHQIDSFYTAVHYSEKELDRMMSDWGKVHHYRRHNQGESVADRVLGSKLGVKQVEEDLCAFLDKHRNEERIHLAGSSVHFDRVALINDFPSIEERISHQIIDVTSFKLLFEKWLPFVTKKQPKARHLHHALNDIEDSLNLMRYYFTSIVRPFIFFATPSYHHPHPHQHYPQDFNVDVSSSSSSNRDHGHQSFYSNNVRLNHITSYPSSQQHHFVASHHLQSGDF